jgi:hypothetical protein
MTGRSKARGDLDTTILEALSGLITNPCTTTHTLLPTGFHPHGFHRSMDFPIEELIMPNIFQIDGTPRDVYTGLIYCILIPLSLICHLQF